MPQRKKSLFQIPVVVIPDVERKNNTFSLISHSNESLVRPGLPGAVRQ
jgi:hypothetical protein